LIGRAEPTSSCCRTGAHGLARHGADRLSQRQLRHHRPRKQSDHAQRPRAGQRPRGAAVRGRPPRHLWYELSVKVARPRAPRPRRSVRGPAGTGCRQVVQSGCGIRPVGQGSGIPAGPAPVAAPAGGIPMDWDPFAPHPARASSPGPASAPRRDALGLDLGAAAPDELVPGLAPSSGGASSLDQLFGLGPAGGGDPLKDSVLDAPMAQPNMSGDADPMRALRKAPKASAPSEVDHLSDLNRPSSRDDPQACCALVRRGFLGNRLQPGVAAAPVRRLVHPQRQRRRRRRCRHRRAKHRVRVWARRPARRTRRHCSMLSDVAWTSRPRAPGADAGVDGIDRADDARGGRRHARSGAGARHHQARDASRRHDDRGQGQQPLEVSPNVNVALQHLLAPPARGFLAAAPAMRETYEDLRAISSPSSPACRRFWTAPCSASIPPRSRPSSATARCCRACCRRAGGAPVGAVHRALRAHPR